ncbi:MAG TPA: 5'-nucleotidase C-terminal domain-containing protein [Myxococcota bacterium]|nr:5'-nucleotidase C-terminal domain-containing protein [Myxococcota bacterium]
MRRVVAISCFSIFLFACRTPPAGITTGAEQASPVKLTVIGTSDFHGALEARVDRARGEHWLGGIDIMAAYIQAVRAQNPGGVVLLDAGDLYQGTLLSAASEGAAVVEFYNLLGYDAVEVGNHDFDFGPLGYHCTPSGPNDDPLGVIKQRIEESKFPWLCANMYDRTSGRPVSWTNLQPYTIITRKGIKIAVIGLILTETPLVTNPLNVKGLEFRPLLETLRGILPEVRAKGAGLVIVLAHAGVRRDPRSGEVHGQIADLARQLAPGEVDLIVSGHEHATFTGRINGIPVVQTRPRGEEFARVELLVDGRSGRLMKDGLRLQDNVPFARSSKKGPPPVYAGRKIEPLANFAAKLVEFKRSIERLGHIKLGRAISTLDNQTPLDSPVGNLVTDAMRATDKAIDIAMFNSGGLRTSILRGDITYGRIYEVVPFDNDIVLVSLTGRQITEIIEHGLSGPYGVMEISGLRVEFDAAAPAGKRCLSIETEDGKPLQAGKLYTVATNDFVINGGDGYYVFAKGINVHNTRTLIREVVARFIKEKGVVAPTRGGRYRSCRKTRAESLRH